MEGKKKEDGHSLVAQEERSNVRTVWQINHNSSRQSTQHSLIQVKWPLERTENFDSQNVQIQHRRRRGDGKEWVYMREDHVNDFHQ